jgi:hypothetical protein
VKLCHFGDDLGVKVAIFELIIFVKSTLFRDIGRPGRKKTQKQNKNKNVGIALSYQPPKFIPGVFAIVNCPNVAQKMPKKKKKKFQ